VRASLHCVWDVQPGYVLTDVKMFLMPSCIVEHKVCQASPQIIWIRSWTRKGILLTIWRWRVKLIATYNPMPIMFYSRSLNQICLHFGSPGLRMKTLLPSIFWRIWDCISMSRSVAARHCFLLLVHDLKALHDLKTLHDLRRCLISGVARS